MSDQQFQIEFQKLIENTLLLETEDKQYFLEDIAQFPESALRFFYAELKPKDQLVEAYLERALQNILDNAYRYTKEVLELSVTNKDDLLFITIKNDGAEIKDGSLEQIFQRFYTNNQHNAEGHLGLGLFIAKTLITAMKGHLEATIQKDVITFTVSIPLNH